MNAAADDSVANMVLVPLGVGGRVSISQQAGPAELVVDVNGWFAADAPVHALAPNRVVDTRIDGAPLAPGGRLRVPAARHGQVPVGAAAVIVNLTAVSGGAGRDRAPTDAGARHTQ